MSQTIVTIGSFSRNEVLQSLWKAVSSVGGGFNVYLKFSVLVTWQLAELDKLLGAYSGWNAEVGRVNSSFCLRTKVSLQVEEKQIDYPDWFRRVFADHPVVMTVQENKWELTARCSAEEMPSKHRTSLRASMSWEGVHTALLQHLDQHLGMAQEINDLRTELLLMNQGIVALVEEMEAHSEKGSSGETQNIQQFDDRIKENRVLIERIREKELALQQADRLASIGQLVAGVAHEINNPLTFIRMNSELVMMYHDLMKSNEHTVAAEVVLDLERAMKAILSGVDRISNIVAGLKYFSRQQSVERKEVNLAEVISSAWTLISSDRATIGGITFDCHEISKSLVCGSYQQLEQVLVNFLQNALRAINKAKGKMGRIRISVRQEETKQGWVIVEIEDNGCGIDSKEIPHIFEPFYSKDSQGMGLGLSIVHGIVKEHGGYIDVVSELEKGTTITLRLPKYNAEKIL